MLCSTYVVQINTFYSDTCVFVNNASFTFIFFRNKIIMAKLNDALSLTWYSYSFPKALHYVKYTKWNCLEKEWQHFMTNIVFHQNSNNTTTTHNNKAKNNNKQQQPTNITLSEPGIEPGRSVTTVWCVTSRSPRHLNEAIVVKLINGFNVMHRNVNQQKQ